MRLASLATLITLVGATAALASDVRILTFPDSVQGRWAPSQDACTGSGDGRIDITARSHISTDASCNVAWITVTASRDGPVYSARSMCIQAKTGQKEDPSYLLVTPRPDNMLLVRMPDAKPDERLVTYRKCM
jgi:hypothetical protein